MRAETGSSWRGRRRLLVADLVLAVAVALAVGAAPAVAASVTVNGDATVVQYRAAVGETNALVVSGQGPQLVFTDPGATISGCPASGQNQVTCTISAQGLAVLVIELGNRNDRVTVARRFRTVIAGESGNDRLIGGVGAAGDEILGGPGDDTLEGRGGSDFVAGEAGKDVLRGGSGDDSLDGGRGDDRLIGDAGRDFLLGGGGDDSLFGGTGRDRFEGLTGNDRIISRDNERETQIRCGAGRRDRVTADPNDVVAGNCERVVRN